MIRNRNIANDAEIDPAKVRGWMTTGKVFYVALSTWGFYKDFVASKPKGTVFSSLSTALAACTASRGDMVLVLPNYTETITSGLTMSKIGVTLIGLGGRGQKPVITPNLSGDCITMSGAGCTVENIHFAAPLTDDQGSDINVTAAKCTIRDTFHLGSVATENKTDIITVASGGDDLLVEGVRAFNTVVDCVSWLSLEAAVARCTIRNCTVQGTFSTGVLMDEATATLCTIRDNIFKNTKSATAVVTFTTGNSTGVFSFNHISGRHTTLASNVVTGTGMDFFENRVVEEAALNGAIIPVADTD